MLHSAIYGNIGARKGRSFGNLVLHGRSRTGGSSVDAIYAWAEVSGKEAMFEKPHPMWMVQGGEPQQALHVHYH